MDSVIFFEGGSVTSSSNMIRDVHSDDVNEEVTFQSSLSSSEKNFRIVILLSTLNEQ